MKHAEVFDLENLIEYQEGSIVSRTVLSKKTGTITLFAFDKGQALSEHSAPFDAFVYIADGEAEISIAGNIHNLKKSQTIIMPANKPHGVKAVNQFKMMLVMIKSEE